MKKITFFCFIILMIFANSTPLSAVFANSTYYGRALSSNIYMYSSAAVLEDKSNRLFEIPVTYFVEVILEENDLFYKAQYNGVYGYILKNEFSYIDKTPQNPFVTSANFRVFTPSGANLRSTPNESKGATNLITSIPFMATNLAYFGICEGEEAISYKGNVWYYCKYIKENKEYFGYVYSPLCDLLSSIPENTESYTYVTPNFSKVNQIEDAEENYLSLSTPLQVIIIVAVSLPCLAIIYFLFKPTKIATQSTTNASKTKKPRQKKKKISRLRKSDYYELDSDYFN